MLLRGEALRQLDTLFVEVGCTTTAHLNHIILGLGAYLFLINVFPKQKRLMHHGMRNTLELKVICYVAFIIEINEYFATLPGVKASYKIGDMGLNDIILNSMSNGWSKKVYVQIFDCEYIPFKNLSICLKAWKLRNLSMKGLVEPSHKKSTRAYDNRAGHSRQIRGKAASSKTYFEMSKHDGKRKKRYVDHLRDRSHLTYLTHDPGHS